MTVDSLFVPQPKTWGLRGDPRMWEEMRNRLRGTELPADFFAAHDLFEKTFAEIVGIGLEGSVRRAGVDRATARARAGSAPLAGVEDRSSIGASPQSRPRDRRSGPFR